MDAVVHGDAEYDRCVAAIDKHDELLAAPAFDPACGTATEQALAHAQEQNG